MYNVYGSGEDMKIIFGSTNPRKAEDLQNIVHELHLDMQVLSMADIGWDRGEIEENGTTIEENSLIKAQAIFDFCKEHQINYPILTDDAGLFCDSLNGEPGVYTARYADEEIAKDPSLPKYECVHKLLRNLKDKDRGACYRAVVTCVMPDGTYFQEFGESRGQIATEILGELKKPYFYAVFLLDGYQKPFNELNEDELQGTYRYEAMKKILTKIH